MTCSVCGRTLPAVGVKGGRPRVVCPPKTGEDRSDCKRLTDMLYQADRLWSRILAGAPHEMRDTGNREAGLKSVRMRMLARVSRWASDLRGRMDDAAFEERESRSL